MTNHIFGRAHPMQERGGEDIADHGNDNTENEGKQNRGMDNLLYLVFLSLPDMVRDRYARTDRTAGRCRLIRINQTKRLPNRSGWAGVCGNRDIFNEELL